MGVAVELIDRRPVPDAPVDQTTVPGQRNAAGPDPTQWKRDVFAPLTGVDETFVDIFGYGNIGSIFCSMAFGGGKELQELQEFRSYQKGKLSGSNN